jgi:hypothetical protein
MQFGASGAAGPDGLGEMLDLLSTLSKAQQEASNDPEISSRLSQYEMSYRMQSSVPDVADISKEPKHVLDAYGPDVERPGKFAQLPHGSSPGRAQRPIHDGRAARVGPP